MRRNQGFTITELMVAVVIMGVLATLAIPSFTSYILGADYLWDSSIDKRDSYRPPDQRCVCVRE